jgi:hypothetical protein
MFDDEIQLLRDRPELFHLLAHYARLGAFDREAWQDRLMELDGTQPRDLTRLHGELIAYGWVVQNTGNTPVIKPGMVAACYRITPAGLRAWRQFQLQRAGLDIEDAAA